MCPSCTFASLPVEDSLEIDVRSVESLSDDETLPVLDSSEVSMIVSALGFDGSSRACILGKSKEAMFNSSYTKIQIVQL